MQSKYKGASIPLAVIERLAKYCLFAHRKNEEEVAWISSEALAKAFGITDSTVRQDMSYVDFAGRAKCGYETQRMEQALRDTLGTNDMVNVGIVGAGNLGKALIMHSGFIRSRFNVRAIFDKDPSLVGKKAGSLKISSIKNLTRVVRDREIHIGVIAVPESSAQDVADQLVAAGVKGLLNLAEMHLSVPENVRIQDVQIVANLMALRCQMEHSHS
ncbi:MAG: hypothetical protein ACD_62C00181G0002 [uncultured bacterium]|nr:MAG: hypothetical protein ACD_62C00181G0002 [uncultured bacterium]HLD45786.1 redox-sensing transcriptional repressor Rex [bacterium]